jgi:hypothetical protein
VKALHDEVSRLINDPSVQFTLTPMQIAKCAALMCKSRLIKAKPNFWRDLFFNGMHALPGSGLPRLRPRKSSRHRVGTFASTIDLAIRARPWSRAAAGRARHRSELDG